MTERSETPAEPGWYRDPEQIQTVRFWDGEHWTDQRAPAERADGLRWSNATVGVAIALAGIVAVIVSVFLPYADSKTFVRIVDNTVIHQSEGKILLGLAIVCLLAVYQNRQGRGWSASVLILGIICLGITIVMGTNMQELGPANTESLESLGIHPWELTESATPGVGIYVAGVGGLLISIGGWLLAGDL